MKAAKLLVALVFAVFAACDAGRVVGMFLFLMDSTEGRTPYNFGALAGVIVLLILFGASAYKLLHSAMHSTPSGEPGDNAT